MDIAAAADIYNKLDESRQEFRLLFLESDNHEQSLRGHVRTFSLLERDYPEFEALSYVWGQPMFCEPITLNGQDSNITANLSAALHGLRHSPGTQPRTLWVDALCINQADLDERGSQVLLMRHIYSQSSADLAFLDTKWRPGNDSDRQKGLRLLRSMHGHDVALLREMHSGWETRREEDRSRQDSMRLRHQLPSESDKSDEDDSNMFLLSSEQLTLLQEIFRAALWSRVWILQELVCAPRVILISGEEELDWNIVSDMFGKRSYNDAFHAAWGHGDTVTPIFKHVFTNPLLIEHQRKALRDDDTAPQASILLDVLNRFGSFKATDPRDRVYGLLGFLPPSYTIIPDYNKSVGQLFEDVTAVAINTMSNLDVICQSTFRVEPDLEIAAQKYTPGNRRRTFRYNYGRHFSKKKHSSSSWVPEYFDKSGEQFLFAQRAIFDAGRKTCTVPCCISNGMLRTQSILIDRIQADEIDFIDIVSSLFRGGGGHMSTSYPHASSTKCLHNQGESRLRAFARTEVRDCIEPPSMRRMTEDEISTTTEGLLADYSSYSRHGVDNPPWTFSEKVHVTEKGLYALYNSGPQPGDVIAVLNGGKVPVVLRAVEPAEGKERAEAHYVFMCVAYLHGYMDGEAMDEAEAGRLEEKTIWLV